MNERSSAQTEVWEREVLANHRWGQHGDQAKKELARLRELWVRAQPGDGNTREILDQIIALEICNWALEDSILALCKAIGSNHPAQRGIGHGRSMSESRWVKVWAYYAALRKWLEAGDTVGGYGTLLNVCDPGGGVRGHVHALLGERTELKNLYVERFCLLLEFSLRDRFPPDSAQMRAHAAAASVLEDELKANDADSTLLKALAFTVYEDLPCYPGLELCHHKLFRRLDIITSSIGAERWRGVMPARGTDGLGRAELLETYLAPIEMWIGGMADKAGGEETVDKAISSLGVRDDVKLFLASLLVSLLRAQQLAARKRAESRLERSPSQCASP